jgi:hypothetical protein
VKIVGLLSWFDERPSDLERAIASKTPRRAGVKRTLRSAQSAAASDSSAARPPAGAVTPDTSSTTARSLSIIAIPPVRRSDASRLQWCFPGRGT